MNMRAMASIAIVDQLQFVLAIRLSRMVLHRLEPTSPIYVKHHKHQTPQNE